MVSFKYSVLPLALIASGYAIPTDVLFDKRAPPPLADGTTTIFGSLPDWGLVFRSSGVLVKDCNGPRGISTCYQQKLSGDPKKNIDKDLSTDKAMVQTNFISTNSVDTNTPATTYSFKLQVDPSLTTSAGSKSVPAVQYFTGEAPDSQTSSQAVVLDMKNGEAAIYEFGTKKVSMPLSDFTGKTLVHSWAIKGGPQGYANIEIKNLAGKTVLSYKSGTKWLSKDRYRLRVGPIRDVNKDTKPYIAYFGDWSVKAV